VSTAEDTIHQEQTDIQRAERIATLAMTRGRTVAVAESLTAGQVSARLGAGRNASQWYRGAVVAYAKGVKFSVLGVSEGPVVSDLCAREMAEGVRTLLGADVGVGITGVGGPGAEEGKPAGTVHLAIARAGHVRSVEMHVPGPPEDVIAAVGTRVLDEIVRELT
jgi:nicotinamide-nucleotide amidase